MNAIESLRIILAKIHESSGPETLADLVGEIEEVADVALGEVPVALDPTISFDLSGFQNSRRGIDAVIKALILLASNGRVRIPHDMLERARLGYDLVISNDGDDLLLTATDKR